MGWSRPQPFGEQAGLRADEEERYRDGGPWSGPAEGRRGSWVGGEAVDGVSPADEAGGRQFGRAPAPGGGMRSSPAARGGARTLGMGAGHRAGTGAGASDPEGRRAALASRTRSSDRPPRSRALADRPLAPWQGAEAEAISKSSWHLGQESGGGRPAWDQGSAGTSDAAEGGAGGPGGGAFEAGDQGRGGAFRRGPGAEAGAGEVFGGPDGPGGGAPEDMDGFDEADLPVHRTRAPVSTNARARLARPRSNAHGNARGSMFHH